MFYCLLREALAYENNCLVINKMLSQKQIHAMSFEETESQLLPQLSISKCEAFC